MSSLSSDPAYVADVFVRRYYTVFHEDISILHKFYTDTSVMLRHDEGNTLPAQTAIGPQEIHQLLLEDLFCSQGGVTIRLGSLLSHTVQGDCSGDYYIVNATGFMYAPNNTYRHFTHNVILGCVPTTSNYFILRESFVYMQANPGADALSNCSASNISDINSMTHYSQLQQQTSTSTGIAANYHQPSRHQQFNGSVAATTTTTMNSSSSNNNVASSRSPSGTAAAGTTAITNGLQHRHGSSTVVEQQQQNNGVHHHHHHNQSQQPHEQQQLITEAKSAMKKNTKTVPTTEDASSTATTVNNHQQQTKEHLPRAANQGAAVVVVGETSTTSNNNSTTISLPEDVATTSNDSAAAVPNSGTWAGRIAPYPMHNRHSNNTQQRQVGYAVPPQKKSNGIIGNRGINPQQSLERRTIWIEGLPTDLAPEEVAKHATQQLVGRGRCERCYTENGQMYLELNSEETAQLLLQKGVFFKGEQFRSGPRIKDGNHYHNRHNPRGGGGVGNNWRTTRAGNNSSAGSGRGTGGGGGMGMQTNNNNRRGNTKRGQYAQHRGGGGSGEQSIDQRATVGANNHNNSAPVVAPPPVAATASGRV